MMTQSVTPQEKRILTFGEAARELFKNEKEIAGSPVSGDYVESLSNYKYNITEDRNPLRQLKYRLDLSRDFLSNQKQGDYDILDSYPGQIFEDFCNLRRAGPLVAVKRWISAVRYNYFD